VNKAIREILQTTDTAYTDAKSCYDSMIFRWQTAGPRWSARQTPRPPTIDPATRASAKAILAAPAQAKGLNLGDAVRRMTDVREKTQARLAELALAKQTYEKCVQQAISMQQRRVDIGRIPFKVNCTPSTAPAGAQVQCSAKIEDATALQNLNRLPGVGGRWGYYWYVNNAQQSGTGNAISIPMPAGGGLVTARLMVDNPTAAAPGPTVSYEMDSAAPQQKPAELQEAARATATLKIQKDDRKKPTVGRTATIQKKYGPFAVSWGSWLSTGINIKKGESFTVKATGAYRSVNQNTDVKTCGPDGCGYWRWFVLKAKVGAQKKDVGSSGGWTADQDGIIELGSPRGGEFVKEDAGNCTGSLSVEVWVTHRQL